MFRMRATVSSTHGIWVKFPASLCTMKIPSFCLVQKTHPAYWDILQLLRISENKSEFLSFTTNSRPFLSFKFSYAWFHHCCDLCLQFWPQDNSQTLCNIRKGGFKFWIIICTNNERKLFENSSVNHKFFTTHSLLTHLRFNFRLTQK